MSFIRIFKISHTLGNSYFVGFAPYKIIKATSDGAVIEENISLNRNVNEIIYSCHLKILKNNFKPDNKYYKLYNFFENIGFEHMVVEEVSKYHKLYQAKKAISVMKGNLN